MFAFEQLRKVPSAVGDTNHLDAGFRWTIEQQVVAHRKAARSSGKDRSGPRPISSGNCASETEFFFKLANHSVSGGRIVLGDIVPDFCRIALRQPGMADGWHQAPLRRSWPLAREAASNLRPIALIPSVSQVVVWPPSAS